MPLSPSRVAAASLHAVPRKSLSRLLGGLSRVSASERVLTPVVDLYCRAYGVDLSDCIIPAQGFQSFDAFFTRELRPGARPMPEDHEVVIAAADGRVEDAGRVDALARITIKGTSYSVAELLGDAGAVERFAGGWFYVVYLSPRDYHRVHAPVSGAVAGVHHVPGTLFPVNAIGVQHVPQLFARNERVAVFQDSPMHGQVCTVMVGAIGVGRISLAFDPDVLTNAGRQPVQRTYPPDSAPALERGDELGTFHLGSTAIVFTRPPGEWELALTLGQTVRMGEPVVRRVG